MIYQTTAPIAPVTLEEVKAHLRIDYDGEDDLLNQYILTATQDAEHRMTREIVKRNDPYALCESADNCPPTVKQYVLAFVGDMYSHRELTDLSNYKTFYAHLLDPYILYIREDEEV